MMNFKNKVLEAAHDLWGLEPQMLMVGEESTELAHAVFKWRRAYRKYWSCPDDADELERKAISRALVKATDHVRDEAMDVLLMIDQLRMMQPADYDTLYEEKLQACAQKLRNAGVQV